MTRSLLLILSLVSAEACTTSEPYAVIAAATFPGPSITGRLEILGGNSRFIDSFARWKIAAYTMRIPDDEPRVIRLFFDAASCEALPDDPAESILLDEVRRVGNEAHFFAKGIRIGGHTVDVDTGTTELVDTSITDGFVRQPYGIGIYLAAVYSMGRIDGSPGDMQSCARLEPTMP